MSVKTNISKMLPDDEQFKQKSMSVRIYDLLLEAIINGKIKGGERIVESDLSKKYHISRPPIREALRMLEIDGLVALIPYKGVVVTEITIREIHENYQMKSIFEAFATRFGAEHFDEKIVDSIEAILKEMERNIEQENFQRIFENNFEFHETIIRNVNNDKLTKYYESLGLATRRFYAIGMSRNTSWQPSLTEHRAILKAIRDREPDLADELARTHALNALGRVITRLGEGKPDPVE